MTSAGAQRKGLFEEIDAIYHGTSGASKSKALVADNKGRSWLISPIRI